MKIVIFEDTRDVWIAMIRTLEEAGYDVEGILVHRSDTVEGVARSIRDEEPTLILADEQLPSFGGYKVLEAVGGEFFRPDLAGGNPKVLSVSSDPTKGFLSLVGGAFPNKSHLIDQHEVTRKRARAELLEAVTACIKRIG